MLGKKLAYLKISKIEEEIWDKLSSNLKFLKLEKEILS